MNKIRSKARTLLSAFLTLALLCSSGIMNITIAQASQPINEIEDTSRLPSSTIRVKYNGSPTVKAGANSRVLNTKRTTDSGNTYDCQLIQAKYTPNGSTSGTIATITNEDIAVVNGRNINLTITIDKITYGAQRSDVSNAHTRSSGDYITIASVVPAWTGELLRFGCASVTQDSDSHVFYGAQDINYTVSFTYDDGSVVDLPFVQEVIDIDAPDNATSRQYYQESFTGYDSSISEYYVYKGYEMNVDKGSNYTKFSSTGGIDTSGDERYTKTGVLAVTKNGKWSATDEVGGIMENELIALSQYINHTLPTKTETSVGTNPDGSYAVEDTVEFSVEQQMGVMYSDTYPVYDSMSIRDVLPPGLTYESAEMYDGDNKVSESDGALSYDDSSRTVSYRFSDEWVSNRNNYNGQKLRLNVTNMGVNDIRDYSAGRINDYLSLYKSLKKGAWKNDTLILESVNPVPAGARKGLTSTKIKAFNKKLKSYASGASGVKYLNTYSYMQNKVNSGKGYKTVDGLHYDTSTYKQLYNYIINHI